MRTNTITKFGLPERQKNVLAVNSLQAATMIAV